MMKDVSMILITLYIKNGSASPYVALKGTVFLLNN